MQDLMPHVAVDTLLMNDDVERHVLMTSCRRDVKEYAGAMLVQVMQIRAGLWCGRLGSSICSRALQPIEPRPHDWVGFEAHANVLSD